jgi:hypothetical protein
MKKRFWNANNIVSLTAGFVSIFTFLVLLYQTNLMREQQRLSVLPYLTIGNYGVGTDNYRVILSNDGIGPAFIKSIKLMYEDKVYETDFATFFFRQFPELDSMTHLLYTNIRVGLLVPASKQIALFEVRDSKSSSTKFFELMKHINSKGFRFEIIYASVYDERWKISSENMGTPVPEE